MRVKSSAKPYLSVLLALTAAFGTSNYLHAQELELAIANPSPKSQIPPPKIDHIIPGNYYEKSINKNPPKLSKIISPNILDSEVFTAEDWTLPREIHLHRPETNSTLEVTYWKDGQYIRSALVQLDKFLRDPRNNRSMPMDRNLIDSLWVAQTIAKRTGHHAPLQITSAYRSKATNDLLRASGYKASKQSLHLEGRAVDFRIPGIGNKTLGRLMKSFNKGGVGTYTRESGGWVHIDTGDHRNWKG